MSDYHVSVVIPALNEAPSIGKVVQAIPSWVTESIVVDNGSTDATATVAAQHGATVLSQPIKGYGAACLKGIEYLNNQQRQPDCIVFMDGDFADDPSEMEQLVAPIKSNKMDMVVGNRNTENAEKGSLTSTQKFGNNLSTFLIKLIYGVKMKDLGPFRAVNFKKLISLGMKDMNYGWTVEMQVKAAKQKLRYQEVNVSYRNRIGVSKVSGTIKGSIMAGYKILLTIFKYGIR